MLKIENVSVRFPVYQGSLEAVNQASLCVEDGKCHVIIGETGSGKSVLLMSVIGLSGGHVTGSIQWNQHCLTDYSDRQLQSIRGSEIAYIPQGNAQGMNPLLTVGTQIGERLVVHRGVNRKTAFAKAIESLKNLDFESPAKWAKLFPHNLSGGMKQRALVAMGTIAGGTLLLADEPTKGLDEDRIEEVVAIFQNLKHTTVFCVSHDLQFAKAISQKISVMYAGQIVETANTKTFFTNPQHPYSKILLQSLPENGFQCVNGFAPSHMDYDKMGCRFMARCPNAKPQCRQKPPMKNLGESQVLCWYAAQDQ